MEKTASTLMRSHGRKLHAQHEKGYFSYFSSTEKQIQQKNTQQFTGIV